MSLSGLSLDINDECSPEKAIFDGTKGSVEIVEVDFNSSLAAIRFFLAISLTQNAILIPEKRAIKQTEKTTAVMFPLRFHSASSALAEFVAEAVLVVVELLVVDADVVVDIVETDAVVEVDEVKDVVELVLDVVVELVVDVVVEVVLDVVVVSEEVVMLDVVVLVVVELVLVVVVVVVCVDVASLA